MPLDEASRAMIAHADRACSQRARAGDAGHRGADRGEARHQRSHAAARVQRPGLPSRTRAPRSAPAPITPVHTPAGGHRRCRRRRSVESTSPGRHATHRRDAPTSIRSANERKIRSPAAVVRDHADAAAGAAAAADAHDAAARHADAATSGTPQSADSPTEQGARGRQADAHGAAAAGADAGVRRARQTHGERSAAVPDRRGEPAPALRRVVRGRRCRRRRARRRRPPRHGAGQPVRRGLRRGDRVLRRLVAGAVDGGAPEVEAARGGQVRQRADAAAAQGEGTGRGARLRLAIGIFLGLALGIPLGAMGMWTWRPFHPAPDDDR